MTPAMTDTSVDHRTRRFVDEAELSFDEIVEVVLPAAVAAHGGLAARGIAVQGVPPLTLVVDGPASSRSLTLAAVGADLGVTVGDGGAPPAGLVAHLAVDALSDLVQDVQSPMGLAMTARVRVEGGSIDDWISWEPVLRALFEGRPVYEPGAVELTGADGSPLDLDAVFTLDDATDPRRRRVMAHFLAQAGFLHVRGVFDPDEMAAVRADIDRGIAAATPDDGESWWATDADGVDRAVRVLFFDEKSDALRDLLADPRHTWIGDLTGDGHVHTGGAEGLVKPLGIVRGLSDLPWHKDCGQGRHAYMCNALTVGISVTGADRRSGALGVIPGSHRANTCSAMRDRRLDLAPRLLETATGDLTIHCSDTLHRAHPPVERPRHVVYTSWRLPLLAGDVERPDPRYSRRARAELTDVEDRIDAAASPSR
ncbi:MAG: hypothetical protein D6683_17395 [Actinomyces sp.]|nr:MAG: hypothetical protein D6683_17395 [Actinomyces sp.]